MFSSDGMNYVFRSPAVFVRLFLKFSQFWLMGDGSLRYLKSTFYDRSFVLIDYAQKNDLINHVDMTEPGFF